MQLSVPSYCVLCQEAVITCQSGVCCFYKIPGVDEVGIRGVIVVATEQVCTSLPAGQVCPALSSAPMLAAFVGSGLVNTGITLYIRTSEFRAAY